MDLNSIFDNLSLDNLLTCQKLLDAKIKSAKAAHRAEAKNKKVEDFVELFEDPVLVFGKGDEVLSEGLLAEIESLSLKAVSGSTSSKWLSSDNEAYTWASRSGRETVKEPIAINSFPCIMELMGKINGKCEADMNSCLVTLFPDGRSGIRLHQDDEDEMDPGSPICVFTVGEERKVEFLSTYQASSETPILTIIPKEGSVYTMKPGCQSFFRHRVPTVKSPVGRRYSLSFRKKIPKDCSVVIVPSGSTSEVSSSPVKNLIAKFNNGTSSYIASEDDSAILNSTVPVVTKRKTTTVLFGTSITLNIDSDSIAGRGRRFINVSKNGATMRDICEMIDNFYGTVRPLLYAPLLYADLYYTRFLGQNQVRPTIFDHHSNFDISTLNDTDLILKH